MTFLTNFLVTFVVLISCKSIARTDLLLVHMRFVSRIFQNYGRFLAAGSSLLETTAAPPISSSKCTRDRLIPRISDPTILPNHGFPYFLSPRNGQQNNCRLLRLKGCEGYSQFL